MSNPSRTTPALQAQQLSLQLEGNTILQDISFDLQPGELLGIIGPNGSGKSSLLKILAGIISATSGNIALKNQSVERIASASKAQYLGYLEQSTQVHWPLQVDTIVAMGRLPYQKQFRGRSREDEQAITSAIARTEIEALLPRIFTTLSGGEQMRVLLARLFTQAPEIILADEPIAALDPYHQLQVMEMLQQHTQQTQSKAELNDESNAQLGSAVVVLHDLNLAARFCDRLLLLDQGRMVSCGTAESVLTVENIANVYGVSSHMLDVDGTRIVLPFERLNH